MTETGEILKRAKAARDDMICLDGAAKNGILADMAEALIKNAGDVLAANADDVAAAQGKISPVMIDRLKLTNERILSMAGGIRDIAELDDPCGRILSERTREDGLKIRKISVSFGVVAVIFESRPNVTSDVAAIALKSGNVSVMRCGKEAYSTCSAIVRILRGALEKKGVNPDLINLVEDTSRASANELMTAKGYVDLLIPRGGKGLISACVENATVPCIETGTGICHLYVDESADIGMALDIAENGKMSRPSVCNALEVCLVNEKIANRFLPALKERLDTSRYHKGCRLLLDDAAAAIIPGERAGDGDYDTEFLDYVMAVRVVKDTDEAIKHIAKHSTGHSECIVTKNDANAERFCRMTDSAAVYVNASTRFTDGGEFGLGAEIGISTQKLHARGPMGLCELTTYKYIVTGEGHVR